MGESYRQCEECGKRALSIATRCPGCGREFPPTPENAERGPAAGARRFRSPGMLTGALAAAAVLALVAIDLDLPSHEQEPAQAAADSVAGYSEATFTDTIGGLETASAAAVTAERAGEVLVARNWTNVRRARSRRADLEAILTPGDTVVADSLERDWYRVALEGEVLGYAHRSTLSATEGLEGSPVAQ